MNSTCLNVFLIHARHQYHQLFLAIQKYNLNKERTVIFNFSNKDVQENELDFDLQKISSLTINVKNWTIYQALRNKIHWETFVNHLIDFKEKEYEISLFTSQYLNDTSLLAYKILSPRKYYLMDEGTASYIFSEIREKGAENNLKLFFKSIVYGRFLSYPKSITYFTKYNLNISNPNDVVDRYTDIKLNNEVQNIESKKVYYLGCSLVEIGLLEEEDYLTYLSKIYLITLDKELYYLPHRKEHQKKLKKIEAIGFKIKIINLPFEIWYKKQIIIPGEISSHYYATVLGNLIDQFKNLPKITGFVSPILKCSKYDGLEERLYSNLKRKHEINFVDI